MKRRGFLGWVLGAAAAPAAAAVVEKVPKYDFKGLPDPVSTVETDTRPYGGHYETRCSMVARLNMSNFSRIE